MADKSRAQVLEGVIKKLRTIASEEARERPNINNAATELETILTSFDPKVVGRIINKLKGIEARLRSGRKESHANRIKRVYDVLCKIP